MLEQRKKRRRKRREEEKQKKKKRRWKNKSQLLILFMTGKKEIGDMLGTIAQVKGEEMNFTLEDF